MAALNFLCPTCNARLRLNDRKLIGRQIPCPECNSQLELFESDLGEVDVRILEETDSQAVPIEKESGPEEDVSAAQPRTPMTRSLAKKFAGLAKPLQTPMGVAWCLAISLTLLFIFAVLLPELNDQSRSAIADAHKDPSKRSGQQLPVNQKKKSESRPSIKNVVSETQSNNGPSDSEDKTTQTTVQKQNTVQKPKKITNVVQQPTKNTGEDQNTEQKPPKDNTDTIAQANNNNQKTTDNQTKQMEEPVVPKVEEPKVDLDVVLKLPIIKFEQKSRVPAARLLLQLENLAGVPFKTDALTKTNAEWKTRELTFELENVTFEELLTEVVTKLDATWEAKDGAIVLLPVPAAANTKTANNPGEES